VRDGQRTKDHENSARHATKTNINTNIACVICRQRRCVPFMMTTKFASQEKNKKHKLIANDDDDDKGRIVRNTQ
jgi:hypothetical protein